MFFEISHYRLMTFVQIGQRRLKLFDFGGPRLGRSPRFGGLGLADLADIDREAPLDDLARRGQGGLVIRSAGKLAG